MRGVAFGLNCGEARSNWPFTRVWAIACLVMFLAGCAIRLAPDYDPSIVTGLEKANEEAMVLFASVASGTTPATYHKREAAYDSVIGKIDALRVTAQARPDPAGGQLGWAGASTLREFQSPTPEILATTGRPLVMMRERDRSRGLTPFVVEGYKRSFETSIAQALMYEKALQR